MCAREERQVNGGKKWIAQSLVCASHHTVLLSLSVSLFLSLCVVSSPPDRAISAAVLVAVFEPNVVRLSASLPVCTSLSEQQNCQQVAELICNIGLPLYKIATIR